MTTVFVPKEIREGETRVAATPATVKKLVQLGFDVMIEKSAGEGAFLADDDYSAVGASICSSSDGFKSSDLLIQINPLTAKQAKKLKDGSSVISFVFPAQNEELLKVLEERKIRAFAMEALPRISRAQKMDALSSQANLAGYKAVLLAAAECPKIFPMLMTAAGTLRPSRVVVLGAGVAGLQAIATARRLGAVVEVSDIRPAVKEQVQSLGADFIEVPTDENMEDAGGYAREATREFLAKQAEITRQHLIKADAVISSALVPGKKAPVLISEDTVKDMKNGCVIVDMAAEQGGNCALTEAGKTVVKHGVKIVGTLNLPATVSQHASDSYAVNVLNIILDNLDQDKNFAWNVDDEIVQASLVSGRAILEKSADQSDIQPENSES